HPSSIKSARTRASPSLRAQRPRSTPETSDCVAPWLRSYITFLFVAATQCPRAGSLLPGHSVRQAVSTCIISTKGGAAALPGQTVRRARHTHRGASLSRLRQMDSFAGKTVLITGASEGIGRALALVLAAQGAHLALNARNAARLEESARQCAARGAQVLALPGDVSRQADCTMLATRTVQRFGRLDALVNNAGITMWSRFDAVTDFSVFERLLAVNYLAAVYLTAAALAHLKESRGLIVAVASLAGL